MQGEWISLWRAPSPKPAWDISSAWQLVSLCGSASITCFVAILCGFARSLLWDPLKSRLIHVTLQFRWHWLRSCMLDNQTNLSATIWCLLNDLASPCLTLSLLRENGSSKIHWDGLLDESATTPLFPGFGCWRVKDQMFQVVLFCFVLWGACNTDGITGTNRK